MVGAAGAAAAQGADPVTPLHRLSRSQGGSDSGLLLDPYRRVALVTEGTTNVGFGVAQELLCQGAEVVL